MVPQPKPQVKPSTLGLRPKGKRGRMSKVEKAALAKMSRKTDETEKERVERIAERFTVMYRLAKGSIAGNIRSLMVSGAPGMGKSHTIRHLLEEAEDKGKIKHEIVSGSLSGVNLYKLMFKFSDENSVILLDDADAIYDNEDSLNVLKSGLDSSDDSRGRKISWLAESAALKAEDIPTQFWYKGSMIFITNKDLQSEIDFGSRSMAPHYAALMSRSHYLDLQLHDMEDCMAWVKHMTTKNHILVQMGLDRSQESEALQWMEKNVNQLRELSIRTVRKVGEYMLTEPAAWETFAKVVLLR